MIALGEFCCGSYIMIAGHVRPLMKIQTMNLLENDGRGFEALHKDFQWRIPKHYNMGVDVCDRHAARAEQTALFLENAAGECRTLTFAEVATQAQQLANGLRRLGLRRGDRVGIVLPQRAETALAHIALWKMGCISVPLSVLFGPDAMEYRLKDSGTRAVITDSAHIPMLSRLQSALPDLEFLLGVDRDANGIDFWELLESSSGDFQAVDTLAEDPALLIYTSGTTGPPKGAVIAHRCLIGNLTGFEMSQNFVPRAGDVMWTPADWAWTGGLLDGLIPALRYGIPVLGFDGGRFNAVRCLELLEKYRVRISFIPPTAMKMFMQVPNLERRFELKLRSIMSAGETVGEEVLGFADEVLKVPLNEMWGQTEFNYLVGNCQAVMAPKPGSIGKPYPGHRVCPVDSQGRPLAPGKVGELAAWRDDPVFFIGYWNREQATRDKFIGEYWGTGDMGYRDKEGYLWFVGRKDDVISTAGHRVGPGEIEDCLLKNPAVAQAAVIGSPDDLRGNIIKAFIVLAQGHQGSDALAKTIQADVKSRLAAHEYPREIEFIASLPMTTTGKVRRLELRQREIERKQGKGEV